MTFINDLPAGQNDCGVAPQHSPSAVFNDQYFGHNAVATNLATMLRQSRLLRPSTRRGRHASIPHAPLSTIAPLSSAPYCAAEDRAGPVSAGRQNLGKYPDFTFAGFQGI
jgi:hypothetical protein